MRDGQKGAIRPFFTSKYNNNSSDEKLERFCPLIENQPIQVDEKPFLFYSWSSFIFLPSFSSSGRC
tara:strand:- start:220 stop:417 length:198 start_codon:yes stop_codon:yes gene_type:complete